MIFFNCLIIIYEYEKLGEIVKYSINEIVVGEVTGIQPYGAFVKLESGETGLIHISEISSLFVKNISDYVKIGQQIRVKVIEILNDKNNGICRYFFILENINVTCGRYFSKIGLLWRRCFGRICNKPPKRRAFY